MKNQCSFNIIYRKELLNKAKNTAPLALQAFINGKRIVISIGIQIAPEAWDNDKKCIAGKDPENFQLVVDKAKAKANEILVQAYLQERYLTADDFREQFRSTANRTDFLHFYEKELEARRDRDQISTGTYRGQKVTLEKLRRFSNGNLQLAQITAEFIEKFDSWHKRDVASTLRHKHMKPVKDSLGIRAKALRHIKTYVKRAEVKMGVSIPDPFVSVKVSEPTDQNRMFLERHELKELDELFESDQLNGYLKATLAKFLFACFTSLRVSDAKNASELVVKDNRIRFMPKKTSRIGKVIEIPLNLTAYKYYHYITSNKVENVSAEKLNLGLKKIAIAAGINKRITFHTARHTFGAQFIASGGDVTVLQQIMGHADIRTTMIYVHIGRALKEDQIFKMDMLLD